MAVAHGGRGADTMTTTTTTTTTRATTSMPKRLVFVLSFSLSALCLFAGAVVPSSSYAEPAGAYQQEYQYQGQGEEQYRAPPASASAYAQMQAKAQPFQKVEVNKGRVWLLFVLGASSLFGVTVLVENNPAWFPAISRANKAMKAGMAAIEEKERLERLEREVVGTGLVEVVGRGEGGEGGEEEVQSMQSTQDAVLAGLRAASANAKETMRGLKEMEVAEDEEVVVGSRPTMIPLELSADDGDEIAVDVVDMSRGSSADEDDAWDDIGSLLDEPIPGAEEGGEGEDEDAEAVVGARPEEQQPEEAEQRKPLFEISGEAIDASISSRAAQFQEELEKASASNGVAADGVDLSGISLEDLQAELQKRNSTQ